MSLDEPNAQRERRVGRRKEDRSNCDRRRSERHYLPRSKLVHCDAKELVWSSGATESINLALKGAAHFYKDKGEHLVTVKTEHKATLDTMRELEREGYEVTYLDVKPDGLIDMAAFNAALRPDTIVVSVMFVNNEIGVIQDIAAIGEICRGKGIIFHVDAAQATGKVPVDLGKLKVDLMSFSAHKTYGPKGMGARWCAVGHFVIVRQCESCSRSIIWPIFLFSSVR